jgi:hypothetical protein
VPFLSCFALGLERGIAVAVAGPGRPGLSWRQKEAESGTHFHAHVQLHTNRSEVLPILGKLNKVGVSWSLMALAVAFLVDDEINLGPYELALPGARGAFQRLCSLMNKQAYEKSLLTILVVQGVSLYLR